MAELQGGRPRVYTLAPHEAFVDSVARGVYALTERDPIGLARAQIFLPNRRSTRAMSEAFIRQSEARATLLPRLTPFGDIDEDEALGSFLDDFAAETDIPPSIGVVERQVELSRLVKAWLATQGRGDTPAAEVHRLAAALTRTLDQLIIERVDPAQLRETVPDTLAEHWQMTLGFLSIVLDAWPKHLAERKLIDATDRRNRLLEALTRRWMDAPPEHLVVAVGSIGSIPAAADLLRVIARLPNGMVVLPGLDLELDDAAWEAVDPRHPQWDLKQLLNTLGVAREEVEPWPWDGHAEPHRVEATRIAMLPAAVTTRWHNLPPADKALEGVKVIEAANPPEEAQVIALALRRVLEEPGKTAALVTPDRNLARRVAALMRRYGVEIDDSAGRPLGNTPPAVFMRLLATATLREFSAVSLLALLKHPLACSHANRAAHLHSVRDLDRHVLRRLRAAPGLDGIRKAIEGLQDDSKDLARIGRNLERWWKGIASILEPFSDLMHTDQVDGETMLDAHINASQKLVGNGDLWLGDAGRELSARLGDLKRCGERLGRFEPEDYPALFTAWLDDVVVRPHYRTHPRLAIWGLMEARLQRMDLMILAGLNEGVWPGIPAPDPWLSPAIRRTLGLWTVERRVGQSAHDFSQLLGSANVLLTRARKDGSAPTVPSRFWLRLEATVGGMPHDNELLALARGLDHPHAVVPADRPRPTPPVTARPRKLSVTEVETLLTDPYVFYARKILRLRPLDPLEADPDAAERGTLLHEALENWARKGVFSAQHLQAEMEKVLADIFRQPLIANLWRPRLQRISNWVAARVHERMAGNWTQAGVEVSGEIEVAGITLKGKADRIERDHEGRLAIIDYKTGEPPTHAQRESGYAPQLPLLALIAEHGGFKELGAAKAADLRYWKLSGGATEGKDTDALIYGRKPWITVEDWVAMSVIRLKDAVQEYLDGTAPFIAKLHPEYARGQDYDVLARVDEWLGRTNGNGNGNSNGSGHDNGNGGGNGQG
ncbi:MAG TPA: double-strand break repair protein AddB [Pedomonas sp.]|uniref:double-strand break repair protein AddB n=1 Tax=Pedomonas sp. TaxID=2976421 RepID=UPI002F4157CD